MMKSRKIVLIMTDTQRIDMLGCYGNKEMKTPCIDSLASEGVIFNRAYTAQPVCGPARSAIFTGMFPHSTGCWANNMALGDNVVTIGRRLNDNGLHTAYIGKWHLDGSDYFGLGRCPDGWNEHYWYDMRTYLEELSEEDRVASRNPEIMRNREITEEFTFAHRCSERAIDFLYKHGSEDFFLVVSFDEPHHPFVCPEPYSSMYKDYCLPKKKNVWDTLEDKPDHQKIWSGDNWHGDRDKLKLSYPDFYGCNSYVDYEIGRVLDAINTIAPGAIIIYTSDHGDSLESHSICSKGAAMYDEITRIPLIIRWPEAIPNPGDKCEFPVSHIDIAPTIFEIAGIPIPKIMEGKSLCPTLKNISQRTNDAIFIEFGRFEIDHDGFGGFQPIRAIFDGRYKLAVNLLSTDELYDLEADPDEMVNLINSVGYGNVRNRLHDKLLDWMNRTRDPFRGYYWEQRPWRNDVNTATWEYTGLTRQRENEEYEPRQLVYETGLAMKEAVREKYSK